MNLAISNFSTGPVNITREVQMALAASPISHRSAAFSKLFNHVQAQLCEDFNTQSVFILSGSGTAANKGMLAQVKARGGTGLVLANGEFGTRLVMQARRAGLHSLRIVCPMARGLT